MFSIEQTDNFDPQTLNADTPFTQADFYGDWQKALGRKTLRFVVKDGLEPVAYFQIIKYPLMFGWNYLYIPYGPVLKNSEPSQELLSFLKQEIKKICRQEKAVFARLDFTPAVSGDILGKLFAKSPTYTYHSAYFQPRAEWILPLNKSADELLAGMHKNHRYSLRVADKVGLQAEIVTEDFEKYLEPFYELMTETARRNGFGLHSKAYYENIFRNLPTRQAHLSIVRDGEKILVINLVTTSGGTAYYVFSGTKDDGRDKMPAYKALWQSILYAKSFGCRQYNFGGIANEQEPDQGWAGLTAFKKKWGGLEQRHSPFYDIVLNPLIYRLYNLRKRLKRRN